MQEICCCAPTACVASHCTLLRLHRSCCCTPTAYLASHCILLGLQRSSSCLCRTPAAAGAHSLRGLTLHPALAAEELLLPVMNEFAFNLESFNPAFTATLLKVNSCRCIAVQRCSTVVSLPQHPFYNPALLNRGRNHQHTAFTALPYSLASTVPP